MTYGELKQDNIYQNADDITICINGEDEIDESYYPEELDDLSVVGICNDNGCILVDIVCVNWENRYEIGWIAK